MRVVLISQNEPFYLAENFKYLIDIFPKHSKIVGCVVANASPFGKKESFLTKSIKTLRIFGLKFFIYYTLKFIFSKLKGKSIIKILKNNNIPIIKLNESINSFKSVNIIKSHKPDLLISILGNQIFKKPIIDLAPLGCLNLHTALLPKYRGLMPTFWVLKNKEKYTGASVFFVDEKIDNGPILIQEKVVIDNKSLEELIIYTKKIGMEAVAKSVDLIKSGNFKLIKNDQNKMTYFSFPTRSDVLIFLKNGNKFF